MEITGLIQCHWDTVTELLTALVGKIVLPYFALPSSVLFSGKNVTNRFLGRVRPRHSLQIAVCFLEVALPRVLVSKNYWIKFYYSSIR